MNGCPVAMAQFGGRLCPEEYRRDEIGWPNETEAGEDEDGDDYGDDDDFNEVCFFAPSLALARPHYRTHALSCAGSIALFER